MESIYNLSLGHCQALHTLFIIIIIIIIPKNKLKLSFDVASIDFGSRL